MKYFFCDKNLTNLAVIVVVVDDVVVAVVVVAFAVVRFRVK